MVIILASVPNSSPPCNHFRFSGFPALQGVMAIFLKKKNLLQETVGAIATESKDPSTSNSCAITKTGRYFCGGSRHVSQMKKKGQGFGRLVLRRQPLPHLIQPAAISTGLSKIPF